MEMSFQRIRNLTTGMVHTKFKHVAQDIDGLMGDSIFDATRPLVYRTIIKPHLRKYVKDGRFWKVEMDESHVGTMDIPTIEESKETTHGTSPSEN